MIGIRLHKRRRLKQSRAYHFIAIRAAAVQAAHQAFPHLTSAEIADALGLTRHQVRRYILGAVKSVDVNNRLPAWAPLLFQACSSLCTTQPGRAAETFERLARELEALKDSNPKPL